MSDRIFQWAEVRHGWVSFELSAAGAGAAYRATVSDSTDVLKSLVTAVCELLRGESRQDVSFDNEPGEIWWMFQSQGSVLKIRVSFRAEWGRGVGEERWEASEVDLKHFAENVFFSTRDLLERIGIDEFGKMWPSYPYPQSEMDKLAELL